MAVPPIVPYGAWRSPLGADLISAGAVGFGMIALDGSTPYWLENRPSEAGRAVIVRHAAAGANDITPAPFSARSSVHEYGGGAFTVRHGVVYFINFTDQGLYRQSNGAPPELITAIPGLRFADLQIDPFRNRLLCVGEDHRGPGEPRNTLLAIDLAPAQVQPAAPQILAYGADFYSSPALSPDGRRLAWLSWRHPNMPWDGTELWLADFANDGRLTNPRLLAGGADEAIFQPQWGAADELYFVSDRSSWWNLYRWHDGTQRALLPMAAEFGLPQWVFGLSTYAITADGDIVCAFGQRGSWRLGRLRPDTGQFTMLPTPYTTLEGLRCHGQKLLFHGGAPQQPDALAELDLATGATAVLRTAHSFAIDPGYIASPEPIDFPTAGAQPAGAQPAGAQPAGAQPAGAQPASAQPAGAQPADGQRAYALFYPPTNRDWRAPDQEKPPLLVKSHGGPTAAASSALNLGIQYWTSRGFAVLDVNYRGSTGYGRRYQRQLDGQWGVVDVADCVAAARYLIDTGRVDGARCAIRGNSAGGYTTLAALTRHTLFRAGASYYGISDLEILARDTHKFESRYLGRLIGPYPAAQALYQQRSPIHHCDQLTAPVIFFQGLEDKVVPPNQAERMVAALRAKGIAVAYVPFADERHGFRQAGTIQRALEAELYFYSRVFGFALAESIDPVVIYNLEDA